MAEQGLFSVFEKLKNEPITTGFPCSVGEFLKQISKEETKDFIAILETPKIGTIRIYDGLKEAGYNVSKSSLYKHRRKNCRCFE